jgi:putative tricarboxylic transport membrane protein
VNRRDIVVALMLMVLGGAVVEESLRMPRYENLGVNPYTAPGIVPAVLGGVIIVFALVMLVRGLRAGAAGSRPGGARDASAGGDRPESAGPQDAPRRGTAGEGAASDDAAREPSTADQPGWDGPAQTPPDPAASARRLGATLALTLVYAVVLVGRMPFWLATFLFVFAFIATFEWSRGRTLARHARRLGTAALEAGLVAAAVTYVFERIFLVRLP